MSDFDQVKYQNEYNRQKYDRITIMVPKGKKDEITQAAKARGLSRNEFLVRIVEEALQKRS